MSAETINNQSRVHGTEMEWSVTIGIEVTGQTKLKVVQAEFTDMNPYVAAYLKNNDVVCARETFQGTSCFLGNGARWYNDYGGHREYATPEDTSFMGTMANEIVGEQMMYDALSSEPEHETDKRFATFALHKRVADDSGKTWGYHESYCVPRSENIISEERLGLLGVHMTTRNIFFGAGHLDTQGVFWLAQKASGLQTDFNSATTSSKPVINLRDEPHAFKEKWARIHVTSGDPTMGPWATRMKLGTTSLVLRLMEAGYDLPALRFPKSSLHRVGNRIAQDIELSRVYSLRDGSQPSESALTIQTKLMETAKLLSKSVSLPDEELWVLEEWEKACHDMAHNRKALGNRVEWMIKLGLLKRHQEKNGLSWDDESLRVLERSWDLIGPTSISTKLRETHWSQWMPPIQLIKERMTHAPTTTRAHLRGRLIHEYGDKSSTEVNWSEVNIAGIGSILLKDPRETSYDRVSRIINERTVTQDVA